VAFTLDESTYSRELAPLAGHYPAMRLGPPWCSTTRWRHAEVPRAHHGDRRIYKTAGSTTTRARSARFPPGTTWRAGGRECPRGLVARHVIDAIDARRMARALAYDLAKETYNL